jgi:hypothetical protein
MTERGDRADQEEKTAPDGGAPQAELDRALAEQLQAIREEPAPERLLDLARELQRLLRETGGRE